MIADLAQQLGQSLRQHGVMLVTAESCTGGWIGQAVTAIAGSSAWFERGFITYSDASKREMLGVQQDTLDRYGAVSSQTAQEMVIGALTRSDAGVGVSVTGIAGPAGGSAIKPVGMVCFAWGLKSGLVRHETHFFDGDREAIRRKAVITALQGVMDLINDTAAFA
ncbi:MAG: CinA family protein [Nitrosomonas sp.]|nr:MAG: CinA family protein [Nitrosomonas sp.]